MRDTSFVVGMYFNLGVPLGCQCKEREEQCGQEGTKSRKEIVEAIEVKF